MKTDIPEEIRDQANRRIKLVNNIGNLTLVTGSLNTSMSNSGFPEKKRRLGEPLLAINREFASLDSWAEDQIVRRSEDLAGIITDHWYSSERLLAAELQDAGHVTDELHSGENNLKGAA